MRLLHILLFLHINYAKLQTGSSYSTFVEDHGDVCEKEVRKMHFFKVNCTQVLDSHVLPFLKSLDDLDHDLDRANAIRRFFISTNNATQNAAQMCTEPIIKCQVDTLLEEKFSDKEKSSVFEMLYFFTNATARQFLDIVDPNLNTFATVFAEYMIRPSAGSLLEMFEMFHTLNYTYDVALTADIEIDETGIHTMCNDCFCAPEERQDCGTIYTTSSDCKQMGCVWCPLPFGQDGPWCFHSSKGKMPVPEPNILSIGDNKWKSFSEIIKRDLDVDFPEMEIPVSKLGVSKFLVDIFKTFQNKTVEDWVKAQLLPAKSEILTKQCSTETYFTHRNFDRAIDKLTKNRTQCFTEIANAMDKNMTANWVTQKHYLDKPVLYTRMYPNKELIPHVAQVASLQTELIYCIEQNYRYTLCIQDFFEVIY